MEIIAHRGLHDRFPENSQEALQEALNFNILSVEIDVRRCKSGEIILYHDRNLKRLTGYNKFVIGTPFETISKLEIAGKVQKHKIMLLEDVLKEFKNDLSFVLDIKKETWLDDNLERDIVNKVNMMNLSDKIIYSSFNPFVLKKIKTLDKNANTGLILWNPLQLKLMNVSDYSSIHVNYRHLPFLNLDKISRQGMKLFIWTLNNPGQCKEIMERYPVDGIITDTPIEIRKCISADGMIHGD